MYTRTITVMGERKEYEIRRATSKDNENILDFMRTNFFKDEPLNIAVGLMEGTDNCPELEAFCMETLADGEQMAPEWGFSLLKVDCTSAFSALAMTKLQAQCVFCMSYADYCSPESGEPVFEPEPPHSTAIITSTRMENARRKMKFLIDKFNQSIGYFKFAQI
ncbi:hypothetical protein C0J52_18039 [Blattella germanica]|nr:hypothetical protein C0J52_18039 [Blattella germanica]